MNNVTYIILLPYVDFQYHNVESYPPTLKDEE